MRCQRTHEADHCISICAQQAMVYLHDDGDWGMTPDCVCQQCADQILGEHSDWHTHPLTEEA